MSGNKWSGEVTEKSDSLDFEMGVFTLEGAKKIAKRLKIRRRIR